MVLLLRSFFYYCECMFFSGTDHYSSQMSASTQESSQDWIESHITPRERLNSAMKILSKDYEPLKHQLSLSWSSICKSSKLYYMKKAREAIHLVLSIIAPGQESILLNAIQPRTEEVDSTTKCIVDAYNHAANSRTQTQILSLIVNNFTKTELQKMMPGVTIARIDAARKHAMVTGPGNIINAPKIYRMKLTKPKLAHFIDFVLNPVCSSVVGFGQTVLKLSSNEKLKIPKVVRNMIHARIISSYQSYCLESGFHSFSKATLYRILKVCSASKQKALRGLDNTSAAGMEAVDNLTKVVAKLETFGLSQNDSNRLKDILLLVNQFLKFEYKLHLKEEDVCADHCTSFALSDPTDSKFAALCDHSHVQLCERCALVDSCVPVIQKEFIRLEVPNPLYDEIEYELENAGKNIMEWKMHLLRTVHQDVARTSVLKDLESNQGLLILDWGMKFLPFTYRETQSDFFGKKGISWHFSCLVIRSPSDPGQLELFCFVHILEDGTQGWFSVANILVHLLHTLKREKPFLDHLFLKSDNAACYHCTSLITFIQQNNANFPIRVAEYNFSEAQSGKDLCDSKTGCCRLHILKHADEGHDIMNCINMKTALESHGGVKGTKACIVSIDQQMEPKTRTKIPGISSYNNFIFNDDGITVQKAYRIGTGMKIRLKDADLGLEKVAMIKVISIT